jgi:hypothetical protein
LFLLEGEFSSVLGEKVCKVLAKKNPQRACGKFEARKIAGDQRRDKNQRLTSELLRPTTMFCYAALPLPQHGPGIKAD